MVKKKTSQECNDPKCSFHGNISLRGRSFTGIVTSTNMTKTATVEWTYKWFIPKYERSETRKSKVHAHNPPCIDAQVGDIVQIMETRPLSKTKNFVIIKKLRKEIGFKEKEEEKEEEKAMVIEIKTREEKKEEKVTEEKKEESKEETKTEEKIIEKEEVEEEKSE